MRPVDPNFDAFAYLKQNKKKKTNHKGWFKFIHGSKPKHVQEYEAIGPEFISPQKEPSNKLE